MAINGHIALISGANRGLGAEVARQLAAKGMAIAIGARDPTSAKETEEAVYKEGGDATIVPLDVTDPDSVAKALDTVCRTYGELHVLVNNAGTDYDTDQQAQNIDLNRARQIMDVNLFGTWALTKASIPLMTATQGPRSIVNVSSSAGQLSANNREAPGYSVSKTALNALTRMLAAELDLEGIRVNSVDPGWVATNMGGIGGRSVSDGAAGIVWAATLETDGPTGGFFHDGRSIMW